MGGRHCGEGEESEGSEEEGGERVCALSIGDHAVGVVGEEMVRRRWMEDGCSIRLDGGRRRKSRFGAFEA